MATELFRRGFLDHARTLIAWCVGVVALLLLLAAVFPSIEGSADLNDLIEKYPEALKSFFGLSGGVDLTTGAGFLDTELFSFMLPLFGLVLAIGSGARTLAGEEESGRLELLFAYPLRRRDAVLAKGAAVGRGRRLCGRPVRGALAPRPALRPRSVDEPARRRVARHRPPRPLARLARARRRRADPEPGARDRRAGRRRRRGYLVGGLHDLAGWLDPLRFLSSFWWVGQSPLQQGVSSGPSAGRRGRGGRLLLAAAYLIERRDLKTP